MFTFILIMLMQINCTKTNETETLECIFEICKQFLENHAISIYLTRNQTTIDVGALLKKFSESLWPVTVNNDEDSIQNASTDALKIVLQKTDNKLLYFNDLTHLKSFMELLRNKFILNPAAKFVFLTKVANIQDIAAVLFQYNILNGLIMHLEPYYVSAYTYNPTCHLESLQIHPIANCSTKPFKKLDFNRKDSFTNCSYTVLQLNYVPHAMGMEENRTVTPLERFQNHGTEISIISTIAQKLNITVTFVQNEKRVKSWGEVETNGTVSGNLLALHEGKVDIVCGGYGLSANRLMAFDSSISYERDRLIWCTPNELFFDHWVIGTKVMQPQTLLAVFALFLGITLLIWWTSGKLKEKLFFTSLINCLISVLPLIIGCPSKQTPRTSIVRFLFGLLLFFSFNLNTAYQTYLTGILSTRKPEQKYKNVEDVFRYKLKSYSVNTLIRYFSGEDDENPLIKVIRDNWLIYTVPRDCLKTIQDERNRACAVTKLHYKYIIDEFTLNCFDSNLVSFPIAFFTRKGFPLIEQFNHLIRRLLEAGLLNKWKSDIWFTKRRPPITIDQFLHVASLSPVFYIMLIFYALSCTVFITELIYHRCKRRTH